MTLVYRVEHKEYAQGPYRDYDYRHWHGLYMALSHEGSIKHPPPEYDFATDAWQDPSNKFGFASLQQLYNWFNPAELRRLRKHGFIVRYYDVPANDIIIGGKQVAFPGKRKSYPCGWISWAEVYGKSDRDESSAAFIEARTKYVAARQMQRGAQ